MQDTITSSSGAELPSSRGNLPTKQICTHLHILSATYGPAEGRRLLDGKLVDYNKRETYVPYKRDVLPFVKAIMSLSAEEEGNNFDVLEEGVDDGNLRENCSDNGFFRMQTNMNSLPLMDGLPMNAVFGDPCPGTTKLLRIEYLFRDYFNVVIGEGDDNSGGEIQENGRTAQQKHFHCTTSRTFQSTFREHERVLLKRQDPLFCLMMTDGDDDASTSNIDREQQDIQSSRRDSENQLQLDDGDNPGMVPISTPQSSSSSLIQAPSSPSKRWRLAPSTAEITLPIILPFLNVRQRAKCQLVCTSWREIVLEKGIAVIVDVNDVRLFPKEQMDFAARPPPRASLLPNSSSATLSPTSSTIQNHPSRSLLRGLLNHSHSSLEALALNDYIPLQPAIDLHPALPYVRKLKRIDISRIPLITDETLDLISTFIGERLEVLYMKGLKNVTNDGVIHLVQSCRNLRVLDVSEVHQLDDGAGIAIGHLAKLEVLHMKNNYKLTNESVDAITRNCRNLFQLTLWGCIRLTHVCFDNGQPSQAGPVASSLQRPENFSPNTTPTKLILLNLWGCHNLTDAAAARLTTLPHLHSLCVSECHRLTDAFVLGITQSLQQLVHLDLRYLRRITDASLESIAHRMRLFSLDASFCTKLTIRGLAQLLTERCTSLAELRLFSCRQLNVEEGGGRQLAHALHPVREVSTLSFLDLRECHVEPPFARDELFLSKMSDELGFNETLHGLFVKPAVWNREVKRQLETANLVRER